MSNETVQPDPNAPRMDGDNVVIPTTEADAVKSATAEAVPAATVTSNWLAELEAKAEAFGAEIAADVKALVAKIKARL